MADAKVSDLSSLAAASVDVDNDVLNIVDTSAGTSGSKKITVQALADVVIQTADSFTPSGTGAVSRTVQAKEREILSAEDFDTLSNALNAAADQRARLFIPESKTISGTLTIANSASRKFDGLIIQGQASSLNTAGVELDFTDATGELLTFSAESAAAAFLNRVRVRDLTIKASGSLNGTLVRLQRVQNFAFENCYFYGTNASETLVDGNEWVDVNFRDCFFRDASIGVKTVSISGYTSFATVVKFSSCMFDDLTTSTDFSLAGRDVQFDQCIWEPTEAGAASANLTGVFNSTFNNCWFGDADGTGTWITAAGEQVTIRDTECTSGAYAYDIDTSFTALIEGGRCSGATAGIKVQSTKKTTVRGVRILLTANNSIGIDVTAGLGHCLEDNDVVISGSPTGTVGYRLASGTTGVLRDRSPGTAATAVEDNSGRWNIDLLEYEDDPYNTFEDHFIGDVLADQWGSAVGTDPQCVAAAISAAVGGVVRLTTGDDAGGTMALNGSQLHSALNWQANTGELSCEFRFKLSAITAVAVFVGLTDQVAALEIPIESAASADTLTANAADAVGVMFDTSMATDNWWLVGVDSTAQATAQNAGVAPQTGTYERWKIVLSTAGVATFYRNGAKVGTAMTAAVSANVPLTPVVAALGRSNASRNIDVDRIRLRQRN
jgi:hypothetical protein